AQRRSMGGNPFEPGVRWVAMSDQSQGEGWWQASDGKWYPPPRPDVADVPADSAPTQPAAPVGQPPEQPATPTTQPFGPPPVPPPGVPPYGPPTGPPGSPEGTPAGATPGTPPGAPAKSGLGRGPIIAIAAAALVVIAAIVFFVTRDDGKNQNVAATKT